MSTIDSGLGWSCDSDYYVSDANTLIGWGTQYDSHYYKTAAGGALAAKIRFDDGFNSAVLMSTVETYSKMTVSPTATATTYTYDLDGVTWYVTVPPYAVRDDGSPSDYPWICYDDPLDGNAGVAAQIGDIVEAMISEANVQYTVDRIPTTNWVKTFVEGVEAETARRVNSLDAVKQPKTMSAAITVDGTQQTTVEGALGAINTLAAGNKTNIGTLSNLKTTAKSDLVSAINELHGTVYTFHIDPDESDSYDAVTYHDDAVGMTPASMGATTFNYGSWAAFINKICKPCMLKFDGTVDYYLDPNDYSKKLDGTASDVADLSYPGNAMVEFPLIWWKSWGDGWVSIADYQVDATFVCYSNRDADGNIIPYFYLPIYNGCIYDGKMRSISGIQLKSWSATAYSNSNTYAVGDEVNHNSRMWKCITAVETPEDFDSTKWEQFAFNANTTGAEEITYATANNTTTKVEWYIDVWCDRTLINALLVLIGKCIDTQGTFGRGIDIGSQQAKEAYVTGSLDDKGLFYGDINGGSTASKIFGIENWWGLAWRRTAGLFGGANNTYLYKMTQSTIDGSTAEGYNITGTGYLTANNRPNEHNWLRKLQFGNFGFLPLEVGSYSTQYYKDHCWTGTGYAFVGGDSSNDSNCGAFSVILRYALGARGWNIGAAPSCKPCLIKEAIVNE